MEAKQLLTSSFSTYITGLKGHVNVPLKLVDEPISVMFCSLWNLQAAMIILVSSSTPSEGWHED